MSEVCTCKIVEDDIVSAICLEKSSPNDQWPPIMEIWFQFFFDRWSSLHSQKICFPVQPFFFFPKYVMVFGANLTTILLYRCYSEVSHLLSHCLCFSYKVIFIVLYYKEFLTQISMWLFQIQKTFKNSMSAFFL